jgi:hypothetical protein
MPLQSVEVVSSQVKSEIGIARGLKEDFQRLTRNIDNVGAVLERAKSGADIGISSMYGFGAGVNLPSRFVVVKMLRGRFCALFPYQNIKFVDFVCSFFKDLSSEFDSRMQQHQQSLDALEKFLETAVEKHDFNPPSTSQMF